MYTENLSPEAVIEKYNYKPVDSTALPTIIDDVIKAHPEQVQDILNGRDRVKGFLVGQIMKATRGQAVPDEVNRLLDEKLEGLKK